jgi:very-short-patch-repair endonuclease
MKTTGELLRCRVRMAQNPTPAEQRLWEAFKRSGLRPQRQVVMGFYIVDFLIGNRLLVVEVDGGVHDATRDYDLRRDQWLRRCGFEVLRFTNDAVFADTSAVVAAVKAHRISAPPGSVAYSRAWARLSADRYAVEKATDGRPVRHPPRPRASDSRPPIYGRRLRKARTTAGVSVEELAKEARVRPSRIARAEATVVREGAYARYLAALKRLRIARECSPQPIMAHAPD